jgi:hypothetical protein
MQSIADTDDSDPAFVLPDGVMMDQSIRTPPVFFQFDGDGLGRSWMSPSDPWRVEDRPVRTCRPGSARRGRQGDVINVRYAPIATKLRFAAK